MSGERRGAREAIDRMTDHLLKNDRTLTPERAREISRNAARNVEHGEYVHTEGRPGVKK